MRIVALLVAVSGLLPAAAFAQAPGAERRAQIRELIYMTGGDKIAIQFANAVTQDLMATLTKARPDIPPRVFQVVQQEMITLFQENLDSPGGMIDRVVPIYAKHFTQGEINELIAFYRTPIGRKTIQALPAVMGESMQAGRAWGESLGPEIGRRTQAILRKEGIELPRK